MTCQLDITINNWDMIELITNKSRLIKVANWTLPSGRPLTTIEKDACREKVSASEPADHEHDDQHSNSTIYSARPLGFKFQHGFGNG